MAALRSFHAGAGGGALKLTKDKNPARAVGKQHKSKVDFRLLAVTREDHALIGAKNGAWQLVRDGRIDKGRAEIICSGSEEELADLKVTPDGSFALRARKDHLIITCVSRKEPHRLRVDRRSARNPGIERAHFRGAGLNSTRE